jgi:hypothetical protein
MRCSVHSAIVVGFFLLLIAAAAAHTAEGFCGHGGYHGGGWGRPAGGWPGAFTYGGDSGGSTIGWLPLASLIPPQEASDCTLTGCPRGQRCLTDDVGVSQCVAAAPCFKGRSR